MITVIAHISHDPAFNPVSQEFTQVVDVVFAEERKNTMERNRFHVQLMKQGQNEGFPIGKTLPDLFINLRHKLYNTKKGKIIQTSTNISPTQRSDEIEEITIKHKKR